MLSKIINQLEKMPENTRHYNYLLLKNQIEEKRNQFNMIAVDIEFLLF